MPGNLVIAPNSVTDPVVTDSCREFESATDGAGASSSTSVAAASLAEAQVLMKISFYYVLFSESYL